MIYGKASCSWIRIQSISYLAPFTSELVFIVSPLAQKGKKTCIIHVNSTKVPITVEMGGFSHKHHIYWIEGEGDTLRRRNGDSAFTNFFSLYQALSKDFVVDVVQNSTQLKMEFCLCFRTCSSFCTFPLYVVGLAKTQSVLIQQEIKKFQIVTVRHGRPCSITLDKKSFRNVG